MFILEFRKSDWHVQVAMNYADPFSTMNGYPILPGPRKKQVSWRTRRTNLKRPYTKAKKSDMNIMYTSKRFPEPSLYWSRLMRASTT